MLKVKRPIGNSADINLETSRHLQTPSFMHATHLDSSMQAAGGGLSKQTARCSDWLDPILGGVNFLICSFFFLLHRIEADRRSGALLLCPFFLSFLALTSSISVKAQMAVLFAKDLSSFSISAKSPFCSASMSIRERLGLPPLGVDLCQRRENRLWESILDTWTPEFHEQANLSDSRESG